MKLRRIVLSAILSIIYFVSLAQNHSKAYWIDKFMSVSYPLNNIYINSGFGIRKNPFTAQSDVHHGIDLKAKNDEVLSMFDGTIVNIGEDVRSGIYIVVLHGTYTISYCHLSQVVVHEGDKVFAGDIIGITGNTGRSTGPHLHVTVRKDEEYVNPYDILLYIRHVRQEAFIALGGEIENMDDPENFIKRYAPLAIEQQQKYGIPASVTLSQMAYESGWGQSELSREGNNFFGIKASRAWIESGKPYSRHDDDRKNEAFCNYSSPQESIEHHSQLLMSDKYRPCRQYSPTDYHHWLLSIKNCGYATDKDYVKSCEKIIRFHRLYRYDLN